MGKWIKLISIGLGLWFFFAVVTPFVEDYIPAWKKYNRIQDEYGLDSGALYYSNVPQTFDSEESTRRAVEDGMRNRREKKRSSMELK